MNDDSLRNEMMAPRVVMQRGEKMVIEKTKWKTGLESVTNRATVDERRARHLRELSRNKIWIK